MGRATHARWSEKGTRPVRVGNCSGGKTDPGYQMLRMASIGNADLITGDYLAEVNIAENAQAMAKGLHPGWEPTAFEGLEMTLDVLAKNGIKVIINGGAQNPAGLARKVQELVSERRLDLVVGYVYGDNLLMEIKQSLESKQTLLTHLDSLNSEVSLHNRVNDLLDLDGKPVVSANAYLGARAIVKGLESGADILICGRVADASPVIGAAWWWHSWNDTSYDELASTLIAGHLLECSGYATGANFSGFDEYPLGLFVDLPFPIAEVSANGDVVITKPDGTNGLVNVDTCTSQLLYELQGSLYLNSDVTADITDIKIEQIASHRVKFSNIKGLPPPPTTKLAIFYHGGYESQLLTNATGYATAKKWELFEAQVRFFLKLRGADDLFQLLEFQTLGIPAPDPETQFSSTTYNRLVAQADTEDALRLLLRAVNDHGQQHFSGFHLSFDLRTALPRPFLGFYPALYPQEKIDEGFALLTDTGETRLGVNRPSRYAELKRRDNYETAHPIDLLSLGPTQRVRLGEIAQARSGDKGANINFGIFVRRPQHYPWLQAFMTRDRLRQLMGKDWRNEYFIERCEFPNILAVHFVVYGPLGRGVSSCRLVDCLGKGFADFIRDRQVDVPVKFLSDVADIKKERVSWNS